MNKRELQEKIKQMVFSTASQIMQEKKKEKRYAAPKMSEEDLTRVIFNGNSHEGIQKKFSLREATDTLPQVTTAEIKEFESAMENIAAQLPNSTITFDVQSNGHYMEIKMTPKGAEALASGTINFSNEGSLKWIFSLQDGMKIMADEPLAIDQENKNIITTLQDYFSAWQKDWKEKLSKSPVEAEPQTPSSPPQPVAGAVPAGAEAMANAGQNSAPEAGSGTL